MAKLKFALIAILYVLLGQVSCASNRIVAYLSSSSLYNDLTFADIPASVVTHVKYAFMNIDNSSAALDGTYRVVFGDPWMDIVQPFDASPVKCRCCANGALGRLFKLKKDNPTMQTLLAVGGWTWSVHFSDAVANETNRNVFAQSIVHMVQTYGFDGVDIDWEFPTGKIGTAGIVGRPNDTDNMIAFFQELRRQFQAAAQNLYTIDPRLSQIQVNSAISNKSYILTLDIHAKPWYFNQTQIQLLSETLDWFNVMAYEFSLNSAPITLFNSNLFADPNQSQALMDVDSSINGLLGLGVDPDKLVLGVPAFGRGYTGVYDGTSSDGMPGLYQTFTGQKGVLYGYKDILVGIQNGTYVKYFDNTTQSAYVYSQSQGIFISYDNVDTVAAKMAYIGTKQLGGMMLWDLAGDVGVVDNDNSLQPAFAGQSLLQAANANTLSSTNSSSPSINVQLSPADLLKRAELSGKASLMCDINGSNGAASAMFSRSSFTLLLFAIFLPLLF